MSEMTDYSSGYMFETVRSISSYIKHIENAIKSLKSDIVRDEYLAFRGQNSKRYPLIPSIGRPLKGRKDIQMMYFEKELIYTAQHEHPEEFLGISSPVELLIKLQHFGIPTRLLDITTNALVALYFACSGNPDEEGEVFILKLKRDYCWNDPLTELIADTYRLSIVERTIEDCFEIYKRQPYYIDTVIENAETDEAPFYEFVNGLHRLQEEPAVIQPPRTFSRLNAQSGQFLLFANDLLYDSSGFPAEIDFSISPLGKTHRYIIGVLRVPVEEKPMILRDLAVMGITRSSMFHDNIDVVCEEIVQSIHNRTIRK